MYDTEDELRHDYQLAKTLFAINSRGWSEIHEHYSSTMFCEDNRKSIISEYLFWEDFVKDLENFGIVYYQGIDVFLKEYKEAVYSCLRNVPEE